MGKSVTPAIGASATGFANLKPPIFKHVGTSSPVSAALCEDEEVTIGLGVSVTKTYQGTIGGCKAYSAMAIG